MKQLVRKVYHKILKSKYSNVSAGILNNVMLVQYHFLCVKNAVLGNRKPDPEEIEEVVSKVTFIYKSFERQKMAKRLYYNLQKYYPGGKVIIADDSQVPLNLKAPYVEVIQLPFNSGLSYGLNRALERVRTPYVMRLDDDYLLTRESHIGEQLKFLEKHQEIDLVGIQSCQVLRRIRPEKCAEIYYMQPMDHGKKKLKIPHMTRIDETHVVVGKAPNIFLGRTVKIQPNDRS